MNKLMTGVSGVRGIFGETLNPEVALQYASHFGQFMAQERTIVEEAYPGDIIGVYDPGIFKIGDTLSEGNMNLRFDDIPSFPPEHFSRVAASDSMKRKQFTKVIEQLSEE